MTIQQIRYALEVKNRGSITKAAKALYTSQPNLSNSIKALEEELGFPIFFRTTSGMTLTEEGQRFFQHSKNLLWELESIQMLGSRSQMRRLHVSGTTYQTIDYAFFRFLLHYQEEESVDFQRNVNSFLGTIDELYRGESNLGILVLNQASADDVQHIAGNRGLEYRPLCRLPLAVQMSYDHPLMQEGAFRWDELRNYPFLDSSSSVGDGLHGSSGLERLGFINSDKSIRIDNPANRTEIVKRTKAYFIGCPLYTEGHLTNELAIVPIPNIQFEISYICQKGVKFTEEERLFLQFFCWECGIDFT